MLLSSCAEETPRSASTGKSGGGLQQTREPHPHRFGVTLHVTMGRATTTSSKTASSAAAAVDRLARGPGLGSQPNSRRRCSSAHRVCGRRIASRPIRSRGYFRRHKRRSRCADAANAPPNTRYFVFVQRRRNAAPVTRPRSFE